MKPQTIFELVGNGMMYVLTATQTKEIFEIVQLVLSILISIIILVAHIVAWFKKANEDGKIDKEELEELSDILEDGADDLKNKGKK